MPIIDVTVTGKPDPKLSARLAEKITTLTSAHLRKDPTVTAVLVRYEDPNHWFAAGKSLAEHNANTFWLDIKVVDGTNTKQEVSGYIAAVFAEMATMLGGLHTESYVLVHEVSAAAYGYGGKTQEFRYIKSQL